MKQQEIIRRTVPFIIMNPTATVNDIAKNAGISRATFHRTFTGRDELYDVMARACIEEIDTALKGLERKLDLFESLKDIVDVLIELGDRVYFLYYYPDGLNSDELRQECHAILKPLYTVVIKMYKKKMLNQNVNEGWIINTINNYVSIAWVQVYVGNVTQAEAVENTMQMLLHGVVAY
ncbi:TetR/AcrR family transcriptional regulator [Erysipelothrix rhusiopathiae]|nr:TetR/AcrR family transcriptional regulator [Erysipelothrix rhusiopathiae]VEH83884.1 Uncharacterized HTH-type transcriptional regulator yvdT [Erysipelothrix rhusiopathiae]